MKNITKIIGVTAIVLTLSGCKTLPDGGVAGLAIPGMSDVRLQSEVGSDELRAACADREQAGLVVNTATYLANIVTALPGAVAGVELAKANPITSNVDAKCHEQELHDSKGQ